MNIKKWEPMKCEICDGSVTSQYKIEDQWVPLCDVRCAIEFGKLLQAGPKEEDDSVETLSLRCQGRACNMRISREEIVSRYRRVVDITNTTPPLSRYEAVRIFNIVRETPKPGFVPSLRSTTLGEEFESLTRSVYAEWVAYADIAHGAPNEQFHFERVEKSISDLVNAVARASDMFSSTKDDGE